jgi:hypothetical protein
VTTAGIIAAVLVMLAAGAPAWGQACAVPGPLTSSGGEGGCSLPDPGTSAEPAGALSIAPEREPVPPARTAADWGVEVLGLRPLAGGYMLGFRYKVIDPLKAAPLHDRRAATYLIDDATGARMAVPHPPTTGSLRSAYRPQAGRTYFVVFANPARFIKPGSPVTVVIGDFKAQLKVAE